MRIALPCLLLLLLCVTTSTALAQNQAADLTVHEWGTFTAVSGYEGRELAWTQPTGPDFGYHINTPHKGLKRNRLKIGKKPLSGSARLEHIAIHFYANQDMDVTARLSVQHGVATQWYPALKNISYPSAQPGPYGEDTTLQGQTLDWGTISLTQELDPVFPQEEQTSQHTKLRTTDATPLRLKTREGQQTEKFLSYGGVGAFHPPIHTELSNNTISLDGSDAIFQNVLIVENRGGKLFVNKSNTTKCTMYAARPTKAIARKDLEALIIKELTEEGLYLKEAQTMLNVWGDSWLQEGLRILYVVNRKDIDERFPLDITPKPQQLVRVIMARVDIITPEQTQEATQLITKAARQRGKEQRKTVEDLRQKYKHLLPVLYNNIKPTLKNKPSRRLEKSLSKL